MGTWVPMHSQTPIYPHSWIKILLLKVTVTLGKLTVVIKKKNGIGLGPKISISHRFESRLGGTHLPLEVVKSWQLWHLAQRQSPCVGILFRDSWCPFVTADMMFWLSPNKKTEWLSKEFGAISSTTWQYFDPHEGSLIPWFVSSQHLISRECRSKLCQTIKTENISIIHL